MRWKNSFAVSAGMAEAEDFADPHYEGGCGDDNQPVKDFDGADVEELSAEFHDDYLAYDDEHAYGDKAAAIAQMQSRAVRSVGACIEEVPELHEDEEREEQRQRIRGQLVARSGCRGQYVRDACSGVVLEEYEYSGEYGEECDTGADDEPPH